MQTPFLVLDTGFSGDLLVTPKMATELGLKTAGVTRARFANGQVMNVRSALALAAMEGVLNYVEVLIVEGIPLVGIDFLTKFGYRAIVDCKYKEVALEKSA